MREGRGGGEGGGRTNQQQQQQQHHWHNTDRETEGGGPGRLNAKQGGGDDDDDSDDRSFQHVTFGSRGGAVESGGRRIAVTRNSATQHRDDRDNPSTSVVTGRGNRDELRGDWGRGGARVEWSGGKGKGGDAGRGWRGGSEEGDPLGGMEVSTVDGFQGREKEVRRGINHVWFRSPRKGGL